MEVVHSDYGDASEQERGLKGWQQRYMQLRPGSYAGTLDQLVLGGVTISRERIKLAVEERVVAPCTSIVYAQSISALSRWRANACSVCPENAVLLQGAAEIHVAFEESSDLLIVDVDRERLPEAAATFSSVRVAPNVPEADQATLWFLSLLIQADDLRARGSHDDRRILSQLVIDRLTYLFGRLLERDRPSPNQKRGEFRLFERARQFLEAAEHEPHAVGTLAAALGVDVDDLRRAFLEAVGIGPGRWLRQYRLDCARRDLGRGHEADSSVSEIAMRWGFTHLGRFAATYAACFGEKPSETIRRRDRERASRRSSPCR